jgi:uncharacterized membrane protein YkvA (DUF1232 family)
MRTLALLEDRANQLKRHTLTV